MFVLSTLSAFGLIWYGHTSYLPQAPIFLDLMQKYAYLPILGIFLGAFCNSGALNLGSNKSYLCKQNDKYDEWVWCGMVGWNYQLDWNCEFG